MAAFVFGNGKKCVSDCVSFVITRSNNKVKLQSPSVSLSRLSLSVLSVFVFLFYLLLAYIWRGNGTIRTV
jgi:hypothetical protein